MLIVQEDGKLRSYGLASRRNRLLEDAILHVLRQVTGLMLPRSPFF
jgi:hypothetical protein